MRHHPTPRHCEVLHWKELRERFSKPEANCSSLLSGRTYLELLSMIKIIIMIMLLIATTTKKGKNASLQL